MKSNYFNQVQYQMLLKKLISSKIRLRTTIAFKYSASNQVELRNTIKTTLARIHEDKNILQSSYQQPLEYILENQHTISTPIVIESFLWYLNSFKYAMMKKTGINYHNLHQEWKEYLCKIPVLQEFIEQLWDKFDQLSLLVQINAFTLISFHSQQQQQKLLIKYMPILRCMPEKTLQIFFHDAMNSQYKIPFPFYEVLYASPIIKKSGNYDFKMSLLDFVSYHIKEYQPILDLNLPQIMKNRVQTFAFITLLEYLRISSKYFLLMEGTESYFQNKLLINVMISSSELRLSKADTQHILQLDEIIQKIAYVSQKLLPFFPQYYQITEQNADFYMKLAQRLINRGNPAYISSIQECPYRDFSERSIFVLKSILQSLVEYRPLILLQLPKPLFFYFQKRALLEIKPILAQYFQKTDLKDFEILVKFLAFLEKNKGIFELEQQKKLEILSRAKEIGIEATQAVVLLGNLGLPMDDCNIFFWETCWPYIQQHTQEDSSIIIHQRKPFEIEIIKLMAHLSLSSVSKVQQKFTKFLNNQFIYTVKSVIKQDIFIVLKVVTNFPNARIEILEYLYSNMSTFIIYIYQKKKFYLNKESKYLEKNYYEVLKNAVINHKRLQTIQNKSKLNILKLLMETFWSQLSNTQILSLLQIFGTPGVFNDGLKEKLRKKQFKPVEIEQFDHNILTNFRLHNKSLHLLLDHISDESIFYSENVENMNTLSQLDFEKLFKHEQFYEIALVNPIFKKEEFIPPPKKNIKNAHIQYVCLKLFQKIKSKRNYDIEAEQRGKQEINIDEWLQYIKKNDLVEFDDLNEFKLDNIVIDGHNEMIEGWNYYGPIQNQIPIKDYGTFADSLNEKVHQSLILGLFGSLEDIKKIFRSQIFHSELLLACYRLDVTAYPLGSLIEISYKSTDKPVYIVCTKPSRYKLHVICAYILENLGFEVWLLSERKSRDKLENVIQKRLKKSGINVQPSLSEESQDESLDEDRNEAEQIQDKNE